MASFDMYAKVTAEIISELERGVRPWAADWIGGSLPVRFNSQPYRGINVLILWGTAARRGYTESRWMTTLQASRLGARLKPGEIGAWVIFSKIIPVEGVRPHRVADAEGPREVFLLKTFEVYNVVQFENLPTCYAPRPKQPLDPVAFDAAEAFFAATGALVVHGGRNAYYSPLSDEIHLPHRTAFAETAGYVSTKAHEFVHWTGREGRLGRSVPSHSNGYAFEELVAELGAAFVCARLGVSTRPRAEHASYIAAWLRVLRQDSRAIFRAAAYAQRAADYLQRFQGRPGVPD